MIFYLYDSLVNLKDLLFKKRSFSFLEVEKILIFSEFIFANRGYLRYLPEEIFANCYFSLKFTEFNFANLPQIRENLLSRK